LKRSHQSRLFSTTAADRRGWLYGEPHRLRIVCRAFYTIIKNPFTIIETSVVRREYCFNANYSPQADHLYAGGKWMTTAKRGKAKETGKASGVKKSPPGSATRQERERKSGARKEKGSSGEQLPKIGKREVGGGKRGGQLH
jgi:hypothetical protein